MPKIIPSRILKTSQAANGAMQKAGDLAPAVAGNMAYQADTYDVPTLRDALADLGTAIDAIRTVLAIIDKTNPAQPRNIVVGCVSPVTTTVTERRPGHCDHCNCPLGASTYANQDGAYCTYECYLTTV